MEASASERRNNARTVKGLGCFLLSHLCVLDGNKSLCLHPPPTVSHSCCCKGCLCGGWGFTADRHLDAAVGTSRCAAHLLATAESWSRMRPSPSSIVSSVSLLSSMVTAETEGLSPHRLGSSWIFIWSRQVGTAMRLMLSEAVLMSTLQSRSIRRGREI